jgi:hypothetical protein
MKISLDQSGQEAVQTINALSTVTIRLANLLRIQSKLAGENDSDSETPGTRAWLLAVLNDTTKDWPVMKDIL